MKQSAQYLIRQRALRVLRSTRTGYVARKGEWLTVLSAATLGDALHYYNEVRGSAAPDFELAVFYRGERLTDPAGNLIHTN